jgi:hypothetical protein
LLQTALRAHDDAWERAFERPSVREATKALATLSDADVAFVTAIARVKGWGPEVERLFEFTPPLVPRIVFSKRRASRKPKQ